ncbi:hypothetical protein Aph01nite_13170 [Acrocarpospora phusangensis]|uniref:Uncharacterized protein n=1 Tax=Acrocarpospora phusangensis TaxID=1070424 RepID=A0A919QAW9_9ACTN|nr:hypothetical protein [Acrocarpospora phusangensis]GIH23007.1 hypothetical protein Aph01nite_13170 [Acrocarpospora phusangensis]
MSWEQLADIAAEAQALREEEASRAPERCPNDAILLVLNGETGVLGCTFCGYRYEGGA